MTTLSSPHGRLLFGVTCLLLGRLSAPAASAESLVAPVARTSGQRHRSGRKPSHHVEREQQRPLEDQDPGNGKATPIIWGDKLFIATAIPTGKKVEPSAAKSDTAPPPESNGASGRERPRRGGMATRSPLSFTSSPCSVWTAPTARCCGSGSPGKSCLMKAFGKTMAATFQLARYRWPTRLCLLRLARFVQLRSEWQAGLEPGFW